MTHFFTNYDPSNDRPVIDSYANQKDIEIMRSNPHYRALFEKLYQCRVQQKFLFDMDTVELKGTTTSGCKKTDRAVLNEMVSTYQTINSLVSLYLNGAAFSIVKMEDLKEIYYSVMSYLQYKIVEAQQVNKGADVSADINNLQEFNTFLYESAKSKLNASGQDALLGSIFGDIGVSRGVKKKDDVIEQTDYSRLYHQTFNNGNTVF